MSLPHFDTDPQRQENWDHLAQALIETGGQKIGVRFGTATLTFPGASATTDLLDVDHGLGRQAQVAVAVSRDANVNVAAPSGFTDTTVRLQGKTVDGSTPAAASTVDVFWIAIG